MQRQNGNKQTKHILCKRFAVYAVTAHMNSIEYLERTKFFFVTVEVVWNECGERENDVIFVNINTNLKTGENKLE